MKYFLSVLFLACICLPASLSAQASPVGEWTSSGVTDEGETFVFKVTIADDKTYMVDFGADGEPEIKGTYTLDGNTIHIQDNEGYECTGKGVYNFAVEGDILTMTKVSDECPGRGGPGGEMKMTRA